MTIGNGWDHILAPEFEKEYFLNLKKEIAYRRKTSVVYPPAPQVFTAFRYTDYKDVKVVVLGQDPYHGENQAHGLSFSVPVGEKIPPSLKNIYKELYNEYGFVMPQSGNLSGWAKQGVFLLNTVLTVEANKANSHKNLGWEQFTDRVIELIAQKETPVVFMLWGNPSKAKRSLIKDNRHLVLQSAHPSPLSAHNGFFGNMHFKKANEFLMKNGLGYINWNKTGDV